MKRKLYALFILIWALGALLLTYLFFFVYYTWTLTINSNVSDYTVELYSPGTIQKWIHQCLDSICVIQDVSPFDYNISIIKADYKTEIVSYKVRPRGDETIVVQLEKQVRLDTVIGENTGETAKEKIQRIRDENLFYSKFNIDDTTVRFREEEQELILQYVINGEVKDIWNFRKIEKDDISISEIYSSDNIRIKLWDENYIFDTNFFRIDRLPEIKNLQYIKYDIQSQKYIIITQVGAFLYDLRDNALEFQYQFRDYVNIPEYIIWVIFSDEDQKKKNFNILEKENVIIRYSQRDKERKVIYSTNDSIDEIYTSGEQIFITSWNQTLELKNFD